MTIEIIHNGPSLQVNIGLRSSIKFDATDTIKPHDNRLIGFQKRIQLQGGQMRINQDTKYDRTSIRIMFG